MNSNFTLILGSKSSRRQKILSSAGFKFRVVSIECDESYPDELDVKNVAKYLAEKKSKAFNGVIGEKEILLTADTIVLLNDQVLGKPTDIAEAIELLSLLSGKSHEVITGVCLRSEYKTISFQEETFVSFTQLTKEEIEFYVKKFRPIDKAGAYGIQEWIGLIGVDSINGSYYNVVGLPIHRIYNEVKKF